MTEPDEPKPTKGHWPKGKRRNDDPTGDWSVTVLALTALLDNHAERGVISIRTGGRPGRGPEDCAVLAERQQPARRGDAADGIGVDEEAARRHQPKARHSMKTASCLVRGTVTVAGQLGAWPATAAVGGRLTPIFTREFVSYLALYTNATVAAECGVHPDTVQRWRVTSDTRGISAEGAEICGQAGQRVAKKRRPRTFPPAEVRTEIAVKAARARYGKRKPS